MVKPLATRLQKKKAIKNRAVDLQTRLIFDSHLHIIDPRFPLIPNQGFVPSSFTVDDYLSVTKGLNIVGGAIVSGSFQGFDQTYLESALQKLGNHFVGATQLPGTASEEEIKELHKKGVRAVRFNLKRGGSASVGDCESLAKRVFNVAGWHSEFYVDSRDLPAISPLLEKLPAIVIDHLGLSKAGFPFLLKLIEKGAYVKASGFGRLDFSIIAALQQIIAINPASLLFGTDLPSTRAPRPFMIEDIRLIEENFSSEIAGKIFYNNALKLYDVRL